MSQYDFLPTYMSNHNAILFFGSILPSGWEDTMCRNGCDPRDRDAEVSWKWLDRQMPRGFEAISFGNQVAGEGCGIAIGVSSTVSFAQKGYEVMPARIKKPRDSSRRKLRSILKKWGFIGSMRWWIVSEVI